MPSSNMINTINFQNLPESPTYINLRAKEAAEIKEKLKKGLKPVRYNDHYVEIGGKTYNGWSEKDIEKLNTL